MRTIIRNNYTPKIGDYHDRIVYDEVLGNIWLFDCDGIYLNMSKTDVRVVNELGDSTEYAVSQKLLTDNISGFDTAINDVDEASQIRDAELESNIDAAVQELNRSIQNVNLEAVRREQTISNELGSQISTIDNDVERLTNVAENHATLISGINRTAVFDVTLYQGTELTLSVTDGSTTTRTPIREATSSANGLMPSSAFAQIAANTEAISHLQNAGLYRGSFDTIQDAPTRTPDEAFVGGEAFNNDYVSIQNATYEGQTGVARYRISLNGSNVTYTFEAFIDRDIQNFSAGNPGLIVGGTAAGTVAAQQDGTGKVNGWDSLVADVSGNTSTLATATGNISDLQDDVAALNTETAAISNDLTTVAAEASAATSSITSLSSTVSSQGTDISALKNKAVEGSTQTTLYATTEALLTPAGMMARFVDVTQSGMPANPDANTFYYTTE